MDHQNDLSIDRKDLGLSCNSNYDNLIREQQHTINELVEKLKQKENIKPPTAIEEPKAKNLPVDVDLLGHDVRIKSNVETIADGKDAITPWSKYHQVYQGLIYI